LSNKTTREKVQTIFFIVIIPLTSGEEKLHTVQKLTRGKAAPFKARITEWRDFSGAIFDVAVRCQSYGHTHKSQEMTVQQLPL
jgi:hypothetical protein